MRTARNILMLSTLLGLTVSTASAGRVQISAQSIIVNPARSNLNVQVWVDRDPSGSGNSVYGIGENISVGLQTNANAYIYLFNLSADGDIDLFFPNRYENSNYVRAGTRFFPARGASYNLNVGGPSGQDKLLAVASTSPLSLNDIARFEEQQQFATVTVRGQNGLAQALSIVIGQLLDNAWVTDTAFFQVGSQAVNRGGTVFQVPAPDPRVNPIFRGYPDPPPEPTPYPVFVGPGESQSPFDYRNCPYQLPDPQPYPPFERCPDPPPEPQPQPIFESPPSQR
ncbi:DUF4384 domain-containing protein [Deinococcus marmoris]|uniref:S-layer-like array-related protein n=1 Tax=Deinococcus marmoris TaxID=249408 RepID=A0A1U7P599_9DEIO|nr:DUF4384 domain-containing protein [Deinococcus marmoris]OLV20347.1 S-layer-like array-related protein [Deinococcus marmoris]